MTPVRSSSAREGAERFLGFICWLRASGDWKRDDDGNVEVSLGYIEEGPARWLHACYYIPAFEESDPS